MKWKIHVPSDVRVRVRSTYASLEASELKLRFEGGEKIREATTTLDATGDWAAFTPVDLGEFTLPAGHYQVILSPVPGHWKAINLRGLTLEVLP